MDSYQAELFLYIRVSRFSLLLALKTYGLQLSNVSSNHMYVVAGLRNINRSLISSCLSAIIFHLQTTKLQNNQAPFSTSAQTFYTKAIIRDPT